MTALRRPPHARQHARGGLLAAQAPRRQNRLAGVPRARRRTVTAMNRAACDMLKGCRPRAVAIPEEAEPGAMAYLEFPPTHSKRLRTNNV